MIANFNLANVRLFYEVIGEVCVSQRNKAYIYQDRLLEFEFSSSSKYKILRSTPIATAEDSYRPAV